MSKQSVERDQGANAGIRGRQVSRDERWVGEQRREVRWASREERWVGKQGREVGGKAGTRGGWASRDQRSGW